MQFLSADSAESDDGKMFPALGLIRSFRNADTSYRMQRICEARGGVPGYMRNPDMLVTPETRRCPFCHDAHMLNLHGWYYRQVILPAGGGCRRIPVRRLRCGLRGKTVSLLPDFCMPRRQHGPAVLGLFLVYLFLRGLTLSESLRRARGEVPSHSVAQALRDGFRRRCELICEYLGGASTAGSASELVTRLRAGFRQIRGAFMHHGRKFHESRALSLA